MQSETPAAPQPFVCCRKWIRNEGCLSEASSFISHFFAAHKRAPEGQVCGRLSFAYFFFGEAKKSEWPPGHSRLVSTKCDGFKNRCQNTDKQRWDCIPAYEFKNRQAHHAIPTRLLAACRQDPYKQCVSGHRSCQISSVSRFTQLIPIHLTRHQHDRRQHRKQ